MKEPTWPQRPLSAHRLPGASSTTRRRSRRRSWAQSLDEVDPELLRTYEKLGIPLDEQQRLAGVAVDAVFDSVSVATTFKDKLAELGVIFCSFSEAVQEHPGAGARSTSARWCRYTDNFFATLNSAVFTDGSFCYIPKGVRCPMELSTYFRINAADTGQFERTLIIADEGSYVSYLEGCTAPMRDENQLHAAVVELVALDDAQIKYSTVQNWYPGDDEGQGRHLQLRHQARQVPRRELEDLLDAGGDRIGDHLEVSERASCRATTRSASSTRWRSRNNHQQADTGTKMIHIGKNTRSTIISKGISRRARAEHLPRAGEDAARARRAPATTRSATRCCIGDQCGAHTFPYIEVKNTDRPGRARGDHLEDQRGPAVLLPAARHLGRRTPSP